MQHPVETGGLERGTLLLFAQIQVSCRNDPCLMREPVRTGDLELKFLFPVTKLGTSLDIRPSLMQHLFGTTPGYGNLV